MDGNYWVLGIFMFLVVLSVKKYTDLDKLRESIEDYIADISNKETIEEEDIIVLEELRDVVENFVIRNPEIFSSISVKDE
tara:strand:+ start:266 stop:505 length:240 start_codon:yes stop_codon:yes gene_type:complete